MSIHAADNQSRFYQLTAVFVFWLVASAASAQTTVAADAFVDSVGINIHLHYDHTVYRDNFPLIASRLAELGVRHVRDGLVDTTWTDYYARHNALGRAGITGVFIASPGQSDAVVQDYPSRMAEAFEAYEAPNEYNVSGDPNWPATLLTTLSQLHRLRGRFPVYGPSLTEAWQHAELGDVSALVEFGNLHNYFSGRNPGTGGWGDDGYGSIEWNQRMLRPSIGDRQIVTTETGYWNDMAVPSAIPETVAGVYMPRVLLEQFRAGIQRTYLYELCDLPEAGIPGQSGYGLLRSDGAPKPAFHAIKGMLAVLSDPGPAFTVTPLAYSIDGGSDVHTLAFQQRTGVYRIAVWVESSGYDLARQVRVPVPTQTVQLVLPARFRVERTHQWQDDGSVRTTDIGMAGPITVSAGERLLMVSGRLAPSQTVPAVLTSVAIQ